MKTEAQWIWCGSAESENVYVDFFAELEVTDPSKALLRVCAVNQYAVCLNGEVMAAGQYEDWQSKRHFQEYDLTGYAKKGANSLMIRVYHQGVDTQTHRNEVPGVWFMASEDGRTILASDTEILTRQSQSYITHDVPYISPQLGYGVAYDSRREAIRSEDGPLEKAVRADIDCELVKRVIELLPVSESVETHLLSQGIYFNPEKEEYRGMEHQYAALAYRERFRMVEPDKTILPSAEGLKFKADGGDGVYFLLDLYQQSCGYMCFDIDVPEGTRISISYGEHLYDLRVRSDVGGRHFCFSYIAKEGRNRFTHWHRRIAGRYLQVFAEAQQGVLYYAGLRPADYPLDDTPRIIIRDRLEKKIYDVSKRTLMLNMHDHFEDCPWREQALYAMDGRAEMLSAYCGFGDYTMAKECLKLLAGGLHEDGQLELCPPGTLSVVIPSFTYCWVSELNDYMVYSQDTDTVRELYPTVRIILDRTLARVTEDGLIPNFPEPGYWNFYEWDKDLDGGEIFRTYAIEESYELALIAFIILALQDGANIARKLGCRDDQERYSKASTGLLNHVEDFWDEAEGAYAAVMSRDKANKFCYAELVQSLILNCFAQAPEANTLSREHLRRAYDRLMDKSLQKSTIGGCLYKYRGMLEFDPACTEAVFEEIASDWGHMLFEGATSFWETLRGAGDYDRGWSLCHGWAALPIYFYHAYGLGQRPDTVYADKVTEHESLLADRFQKITQ